MSAEWAERQRRTNRLARRLAKHVFTQRKIAARQLFGLSKLAWITRGDESESYIKSTKIPALSDIVGKDYSSQSLEQVAEDISRILKDRSLIELICAHTGFTNFYNAYRNSAGNWVETNKAKLLPMYKAAYSSRSTSQRRKLVSLVESMPDISKPNLPELMGAESFLTPTFFMLDPEIKFPLINGRKHVQGLLKVLNVAQLDLVSQYDALVSLYGEDEITDAADLDQVGLDIPDFFASKKIIATNKIWKEKGTLGSAELPLKDEADVEAIKDAGTVLHRRIHNRLTNRFGKALRARGFKLLEGRSKTCTYDILIKRYNDRGEDLLIEAKSSVELPQIRMAIGQIYSYWFELGGGQDIHLAFLLPARPEQCIIDFLDWVGVGIMWYERQNLRTYDDWLQHLTVDE